MKKFDFIDLYRIIERRIKSKNRHSYSYKLYKNPRLLYKKIMEEARELTLTKNKSQVIWEAADLLYFVSVFLVKRKVSLYKVRKKLRERNNKHMIRKVGKRQKKRYFITIK